MPGKPLVKRLLWLACALGVVAVLVAAFRPRPASVDIVTVTRGPLRVTVDEDGKTRIRERYVVAAPLAGQLLRVELKPGATVLAGQTLVAAIEPEHPTLLDERSRAQAEARVKAAEAGRKQALANEQRARAAHEFAVTDLQRTRDLRVRGSAALHEYESAIQRERTTAEERKASQFGVRIAEFELEQAQAAFLQTRLRSPGEQEAVRFEIRSPINGKVLRVFQESATAVTSGTRLLEVGDPRDLEVEIDVLSADAVKIPPGAPVLLEHWGGEKPLRGRVRLVEPAAFTKVSALGVEEQRVWVMVSFEDPPEKWHALGDAYRVEARIVVWESDNVRKLPSGTLIREGDAWAVYRVQDGQAVHTPVQVGRNNGLEAEVLAGVADGDAIVLHPSDKISDGVAVVPR
jgi:HlyD family secretion protein